MKIEKQIIDFNIHPGSIYRESSTMGQGIERARWTSY